MRGNVLGIGARRARARAPGAGRGFWCRPLGLQLQAYLQRQFVDII